MAGEIKGKRRRTALISSSVGKRDFLAAINLSLKTVHVYRRRHCDRETRLLAIAHGMLAAAEIGIVAKTLEVTPQAARRIVAELGLREMTGRRRFRARGVLCDLTLFFSAGS